MIGAGLEADCLLTVEQDNIFEKQPELKMIFEKEFSRAQRETAAKKVIEEWENVNCFKH